MDHASTRNWDHLIHASPRRGHQKAITAVARKMLASIYHVLKRQEEYHGQRDELLERKTKRLQRTVNSNLWAK